jgi:hypothetical protein
MGIPLSGAGGFVGDGVIQFGPTRLMAGKRLGYASMEPFMENFNQAIVHAFL